MEQQPKRPNVRAIAKRAGTSIATVSRVLNRHPDVAPETRARVLAALEDAQYTVPGGVRRRTMVLGLLIGRLSSSYSAELLHGVSSAAEEHGYNVMLFTLGDDVSQEDRSIEALLGGQIDGLLLVLPRNTRRQAERLREHGRPFVVIDHRELEPWGPTVGCTDERGGYEGTKYLLSLGHRKIAAITGPHDWRVNRDRLAGYRTALEEAGLPFDEALVREGNFGQRSGFAAACDLLREIPDLSAVFAFNDAMAIGAMDAFKAGARRIPEEISVLGFGDWPEAAAAHPALTTVHQPTREMGRYAVSSLVRQITGLPLAQEQLDLPTMLVQRASCALPLALSTQLQLQGNAPTTLGRAAHDGASGAG
jgi:DNA-binding LacI/PurR family transcriptional regulator